MSYHLFDVYGVELEYMIVDQTTRKIRPIADQIFKEATGSYIADYENGNVAWSNELVSHVVEIKTNGPASTMNGLGTDFHQNVLKINSILEKHNAVLMPGGAHPTVDPLTETQIWPHEHNEVYALYNRVFNCKGHGWSNLQSTHINLPFTGDEEFKRLHAAIRILLPFIPALSASTPFFDGKFSGFKNMRLEYYRKNQAKIPIIAGLVIPERVFSKADYYQTIFNPINLAIKPYDSEGILDHHFLNSRGAIARFDRGAIEIRIIDIQECPKMDIAILNLIVAVLKHLCALPEKEQKVMQRQSEQLLSSHFLKVIKEGEDALIDYPELNEILGLPIGELLAKEIWESLLNQHQEAMDENCVNLVGSILTHGTLASRMVKFCGTHPTLPQIDLLNQRLITSLANNEMFTA
ncbi:MAG: glutamate--cysteine ligase [Flavobacteriales bacterium]|nr:glutamate--cysteine ligase [Flavobacteriales bacterium]